MKSLKERRKYYSELNRRKFSEEEIVRLMDMDELTMNANRGGELAIKELKRRKAIAALLPMPADRDLDLGC